MHGFKWACMYLFVSKCSSANCAAAGPVYDALLFLFLAVINACNASLRSDKFSAMATRTRKQYLNDLAENHVTAINIEQANTSGRVGTIDTIHVHAGYNVSLLICILLIVAGILRNLGHKKKERTRQESTLLYTPGALTWKVSIILRTGKVSLHIWYGMLSS